MSIVVQQLGRRFGSIRALDGVNFELAPGQIVGLIGPNGAGKTTLLRIVATLCAADEGRAVVSGFDCARQPAEVRRHIGFVPENPPAIPESRVDEYLAYRAALHDLRGPAHTGAVDRVLEQCQLRDVRHRLARHLSHGYRRRLSLAEALLNDPSVLLLDEPTIGLDPLQIRQTHDLLSALAAERTILLSTHLLADAETLCQRALVLLRGQLVDDVQIGALSTCGFEAELLGPIEAVRGWLQGNLASATCAELPDGWCRVSVRDEVIDRREEVAARCVSNGWRLRELRRTTPSLEERLVRLTVQMRS